ncbi:MAG: NAD-dependent epimerase/dehydratase family protein [Clostridium sp.]
MKNILILGGSYFIGKAIVEDLLNVDSNYKIYTLNRGSRKVEDTRITNIVCDRNNLENMKEALREYNFHYVIDVSALDKIQLEILHEAINYKELEKFIFISSSAIYDIGICKIPINEDDKMGENRYWGSYGTNKIQAEEFLIDKFKNTNTELVILRPPYVYGENNYAAREGFIFHHIINERAILIPNEGETKIQFIYSKDLAKIVSVFLKKQSGNISVYNVGNSATVTFNEWIELCERAANKSAIKKHFYYENKGYGERDFFPFFNYDNVLDVSDIHEIFLEETSMVEGLKYCYKWYLDNRNMVNIKENVTENEEEIYKLLES